MRAGVVAPVGVLVSVVIHLALLTAVAVPHHHKTSQGEAYAVELIPASEVPSAVNEAITAETPAPAPVPTAKPDAQPDFSKLQPAQPVAKPQLGDTTPTQRTPAAQQKRTLAQQAPPQQAQPQQPPPQQAPQQQPQQQQARQQQTQQQQTQQQQTQQQQPPQQQALQQQPQPQPQQSPPQQTQQMPQPSQAQSEPPSQADHEPSAEELAQQGNRLAELLRLPSPGGLSGGSEAETKADLKNDEMVAFKTHLKSCWTLPPGFSETQKLKVIVRVRLNQNGSLAGDPTLVEAPPPSIGLPLVQAAFNTIKQCQPYTMLPAAKYKEWRVLDLNFSPDAMGG